VIELRNIGKYFPSNGVNALDKACFELRSGEIHALLGENGAGKSTLMQIMAGYLKPGSGHILIDGKEHHFSAPADALSAGIGMVRQHPHLIPGFKVWEDCILGTEPHTAGLVNLKKARDMVYSLSEQWGFALPLNKNTETLTISQRQKAAVLALLLRGRLNPHCPKVRCMVFDEATAVLSPGETEGLFTVFRLLRDEGKGIVIISHKLEETLSLADRVSVLRRGKTTAVMSAASLNSEEVSKLMFGITESEMSFPVNIPGVTSVTNNVTTSSRLGMDLRIQGLSIKARGRPFIRHVDLDLPPGKIFGIAGVRDSGLETLELAVTGFITPTDGTIFLGGQNITGKGPRGFRDARGAYICADRTGTAMAPSLRLRDNIIIHAHRRSCRGFWGRIGITEKKFLNSWIDRVLKICKIDRNPRARADSLSGGMLQRIMLVREFIEDTDVMILAEPGWGLDRAAREQLHKALRENTEAGKSALIFSTDVDELLSLADEIFVLRNGEFSARISLESLRNDPQAMAKSGIKERIGRAMVGVAGEVDHV
jgi:simple sugar transport system ATP-binding protein